MAWKSDLVVFSHLRWNFVFQRPQQILSRMASSRRVFFIEEPVRDPNGTTGWEFHSPQPNVTVCCPHLPQEGAGFSDAQIAAIRPMIGQLLTQQSIIDYVAWMYTPMAMPLLRALSPSAIVYDCMDELSMFLGAPPELLVREAELLVSCDLVFTGGPSLYRHKKDRHPDVHCFPSSVDAKHFGKGGRGMPEAADQADIPHPRLGYFGVIDERIDLPLIEAMADARPDWHIVMVGPVAKIDEKQLPRRENIHYFGMRSYDELPTYLAGWDVCLLPFARNDATRMISPTKVLEYMAAERPIVSTPITDVAEPYGRIVYLGETPEEFLRACDAALTADEAERAARADQMREVLAATSWDATVRQMESLVERVLEDRRPERQSERSEAAGEPLQRLLGSEERRTWPALVIGAGPTGLSAAYHLGEDALLLEQNEQIGGWCRSLEVDGFTFDYAGHIMFSNDPYVHELYGKLLGDNVHWQDREAWIFSKGVYTRYPFQGALYGLPPKVIKECILGAIEARFGSAAGKNGSPSGNGSNSAAGSLYKMATAGGNGNGNGKAAACDSDSIDDCCADGVLESTAPLGHADRSDGAAGEPRNFEEFIYKVWGAGIAKHFAIPYNRKLWAVPLAEMETSWLGGRVPMPDLEEMIDGALQPVPKPMGPNARFGYPLRGGFQALMDGFLPHIEDRLWLDSRVSAVSPSRRTVTLDDGTELGYEHLISTMPLPVLVRMMGDEVPEEIRRAAAKLRYVSVRCVHLGVGRENLTEKHWIYYPEDTVFHRIFVQGNASPHCNPPGGFGLTCEITYSPHKPLPCDGQDLIDLCARDCRRVGIIDPDDSILVGVQCDLPHAYVVYDHERRESVATIRAWLAEQDVLLAGRYSEWEYYNSDHAFLAGKRAAEAVHRLQSTGTFSGVSQDD